MVQGIFGVEDIMWIQLELSLIHICHLDGDVARLIRFKEAISVNQYDSEVICFEFQADYLRAFLNGLAKIKVLEMSLVESELGL